MGLFSALRRRYPRVLNANQAARALGLSRRQIVNLCQNGQLSGAYQDDDRNTNGQWWIPEEAVEAYKNNK